VVDHPGIQQTVDGPFQQRAPVEFTEGFGNADAQSLARPCSRDYGDYGRVQERFKTPL
jgi:hypothetical protein